MLRFLMPLFFVFLPGCGTRVEVQVVDVATGQPVRGALVRARERGSLFFPRLSSPDEERTNEQGVATLRIDKERAEGFSIEVPGYRHLDRFPITRFTLAGPDAHSPPARWTEYVELGEPPVELPGPVHRMRIVVVERTTTVPIFRATVVAGEKEPFPTNRRGQTIVYVRLKDDREPVVSAPGLRAIPRPFPEWWRFKRALESSPVTDDSQNNPPTWIIEMEPTPARERE